jgi:predicted transcriptional regulator
MRFIDWGENNNMTDAKGGVRLAKSLDEVRAHAEEMLGNTLVTIQTGEAGKQVNRLYITDGVDIAKEYYLSLLVDRATGRVAFVVSTEGGMDIETVAHDTPELITTFTVDPAQGFQPHHGRAVAFALKLQGDLNKQAQKLAKQLYDAFLATDCEMLEINPLVESEDGKLLVLDAKMSFDGNALYRHPDIEALRDETEEDPAEVEASEYDLAYIKLDGNIGCMVNGAGLAMATMDIIKLNGAFPANFLDVGGGATTEKVTAAFKSNWAQRSCRDATFMRRQLKDFPTMADSSTANYIELAADIVSAYVSNNSVSAGDLPGLINSVHNALLNVTSGKVEAPAEPLKPVVPVKKSITPDYIICLEDGKKFKSLKRHLRTQYNLSPEDYREKWGLPADYPMVAPNYAAARSQLAKQMGLGQQRRRKGR